MEAVKEPDGRRDQTIERLIVQYQTPLPRLCYIQLRDRAVAEDAVQETFLKAYKSFGLFRGDCSEKTWLTRIAANTCRDFLRGAWFRHTDRRVTPEMLPAGDAPPDTENLELSMAVVKLPPETEGSDDPLLLSGHEHGGDGCFSAYPPVLRKER